MMQLHDYKQNYPHVTLADVGLIMHKATSEERNKV